MNRMLVLLSVYNGSRFLQEQIDSILNQEEVVADILIRDDASSDDSLEIINKNIANHPDRITLIKGENLGSTESFSKLLEISLTLPPYDYYAFSDQDDVWMPRKLSEAASCLAEYADMDLPVGYCSNTTLVDEHLNFMKLMHNKKLKFTKESALLQNIATGCTMVFNINAVRLYVEHKPEDVKMHDHQMFLVCLYLGKFIYDCNSYIQYRQHGSNQVGDKSFISRFKRRIKHLGESDDYYYSQSCSFLSSYKNLLSEEDIRKIEFITNYKKSISNRMALLFNTNYRFDTLEFNITMWLKILLGKL